MCGNCWTEAGSPTERTPQTQHLVDLIEALYSAHPTGGPLHSVLDDWNLDDAITPYYDCWTEAELDEPCGDEGDGTTREVCDEIAALLNGMSVPQRYAALAYAEGLAEVGVVRAIQYLAQPYAGRPGWREEWRAEQR